MNELDEIRIKKLAAFQQQKDLQRDVQEQQQIQQQVAQLEAIVKQAFTKEALVRYGNIKAAFPEKAVQILVILAQAIQAGKIKQVDDIMFKQILQKIQPEKRDIRINRA